MQYINGKIANFREIEDSGTIIVNLYNDKDIVELRKIVAMHQNRTINAKK